MLVSVNYDYLISGAHNIYMLAWYTFSLYYHPAVENNQASSKGRT
jgi:hypothetical protein